MPDKPLDTSVVRTILEVYDEVLCAAGAGGLSAADRLGLAGALIARAADGEADRARLAEQARQWVEARRPDSD